MNVLRFLTLIFTLVFLIFGDYKDTSVIPATALSGRKVNTNVQDFELNSLKLKKQNSESAIDFANRVNIYIHNNSFHCNPFKNYIGPQSLTSTYGYQGVRYSQCGLCSQRSYWLNHVLRKNNLTSNILGIDGHVFTTLNLDKNVIFALDPDYGVSSYLLNLNNDIFTRKTTQKNYGFTNIKSPSSSFLNQNISFDNLVSYFTNSGDEANYNLELLDELYRVQESHLNSKVFLNEFEKFQKLITNNQFDRFFIESSAGDKRGERFLIARFIHIYLISKETNTQFDLRLLKEWYST